MSAWRAARIAGVGGAAAIGLIALVAWESRAREQGTEVRMAMEAFDPRNLLTGHYAALQLTDRLPDGVPCPPRARPDRRGRAWIVLRRAGDRHRVAATFSTREAAERSGRGVVVRGRVDCLGRTAAPASRSLPSVVRTDLGVERFYAEQAEAEAIETALRGAPPWSVGADDPPAAFAVISVGRDGRARLKGVIVEGRRIDLDFF